MVTRNDDPLRNAAQEDAHALASKIYDILAKYGVHDDLGNMVSEICKLCSDCYTLGYRGGQSDYAEAVRIECEKADR